MPTTLAGRKEQLARLLEDARERTLALIAPVSEEDLRRQHDPLMGPILWDLGHIAHFEALWLLQQADAEVDEREAARRLMGEMPGMFNPFENPRRVRGGLALPSLAETLAVLADVRAKVLAKLADADLDAGPPLLRHGYVHRMVVQHELQHGETILQTLQLKQGEPYAAPRAWTPPRPSLEFEPGAMRLFPGGRVGLGTDDRAEAYDNERPLHAVELSPFWIDATPVTNGQYLAFLEMGGYGRREFWSDAGWAWREEAGLEAPKHWSPTDDGWAERFMDRTVPLDPERPVVHVCYWEAEAFACWAGKRLPTEAEWEAAATWDPARGRKRKFPWGDEPADARRANVDQLAFETAPVGAYAENLSPIGCYGMIGDVWEWTSTDFHGYPGFRAFPYQEYSEVFFGDEYKVLRGGSWATRPGAVRGTFRNWDYPIRRQIFAGFRCARDA